MKPRPIPTATPAILGIVLLWTAPGAAALLDSAEVRLRIRNDSIPFDTAQHPGVNPMGASLGANGALLLGGTAFSGIDTVNALAPPPS